MRRVIFSFFITLCIHAASHLAHSSEKLSRESLIYRLDNLKNEEELLIRNQNVDRQDLKRQKRDLENFKVYDRIPFQSNLEALKIDLTQSSHTFQVKLMDWGTPYPKTKLPKAPPTLPKVLYTDESHFRLTDDQIVETLIIPIVVKGSEENVTQWIHSWPDQQLRIIELEEKQRTSPHTWKLKLRTYRFRSIQFPTLRARNPRELVPSSLSADPLLTRKVQEIETLIPQARHLYKVREQFLLNDARLTFYLAHSVGKS